MNGYHWDHTIILGKGLAYDLYTLLLHDVYTLGSDLCFLHLKEGVLRPVNEEDAKKISYVARLILWARASTPTPAIWSRHNLIFFPVFASTFMLSLRIATFVGLKWPFVWGIIGALCYRNGPFIFGLKWRARTQASEIANTQNDLIREPLDRKITCKQITTGPKHEAVGLFEMLPPEVTMKICALAVDIINDLRPFSRTCKWATQFYHKENALKSVLHLEGIPTQLFHGMRDKLGNQVLDKMQFMWCTSVLKKTMSHLPIDARKEKVVFENISKLAENRNESESLSYLLPKIKSVLAHNTFFITINPDWLGNHKFLRTVTAAGTPAFIFVYKSNLPSNNSCRFYHKDRHILILAPTSPYRLHEWGIVLQSWASGRMGPGGVGGANATPPYEPDSNHYLRLAFDQAGRVIPECQAVCDWFMRFLEGQEVGFFDTSERFYPWSPQQRLFIQFETI